MSKITKKELLNNLNVTFSNGLRAGKSTEPREYLQKLSLDYNKCTLGYNSAQFHHRESEEFKKSYAEIGMLTQAEGVGANAGDRTPYTCIGKEAITYPLVDENKEIINFYFDRFKLDTPVQEYLYSSDGLYPSYPKAKTKTLYLCYNPIDTASLISAEILDNREEVLSLFEGKLTLEIKQALRGLSELDEIIHITSSFNNEVLEELKEILPNIQLSTVELPSSHNLNDMLVNYGADGILDLLKEKQTKEPEQQLEIVNPTKIVFKGLEATYQIVGALPMDMSHFRVSLQIIHPQTQRKDRKKIDLYSHKEAITLAQELADKNTYNISLLESDMLKLADLLEEYREKLFEEEENRLYINKSTEELTPQAERTAVEYLQQENLLSRVDTLLAQSGIVGEEQSRMHLFVIGSSYKSAYPLHGLVQASSGTGKSALINGIANLIPQEDLFNVTSVTAKSLNYYTNNELIGKLVVIQDWDGLNDDAQYSFRELQSAGFVNTSTIAKNQFGTLHSTIRRVQAHFSSLMATTHTAVYHDNETRSILIGVDESEEQTKKIAEYQNKRFTGEINKHEQEKAKQFIRNCLRVLKPVEVINPYANTVTLPILPNHRRLNEQFNSYVAHITYLHQYQREQDEQGRIITTLEDIKQAIDLFFPSLILKVDELNSSTRQLFDKLKEELAKTSSGKNTEFNKADFKQYTGLKNTKAHEVLKYFLKIEYIEITRGTPNKGFYYQVSEWNDRMDKFKDELKENLKTQLANTSEYKPNTRTIKNISI